MNNYSDCIIEWDNDNWRVIGQGAINSSADAYDDDLIYVHLASTTRFRCQKNGNIAIQICDWVPVRVLRAASVDA